MATTPETNAQDQEAFASAFNSTESKKPEMTEDEAFGMAADDAPDSPEGYEAPQEDVPVEGVDAVPAEAAAEPVAEAPGDAMPEESMSAQDIQRQKSWEGRLKAREAELKAREEALTQKATPTAADPAEAGEDPAEEAGESTQAEAIEDAVEKVQSGELTVDQAMKTLGQDFGPDFVKMLGFLIEAKATEIAGKTADEKVGAVSSRMDGIVNEIVGDKERAHFEGIVDAHPDFAEVAASAEFRDYVENLPASEKEAAMATIETGSARAIVKLLSSYKGSANKDGEPDEVDSKSMDAAEGVRSGGIKIPEKPGISEDYSEAWDTF